MPSVRKASTSRCGCSGITRPRPAAPRSTSGTHVWHEDVQHNLLFEELDLVEDHRANLRVAALWAAVGSRARDGGGGETGWALWRGLRTAVGKGRATINSRVLRRGRRQGNRRWRRHEVLS